MPTGPSGTGTKHPPPESLLQLPPPTGPTGTDARPPPGQLLPLLMLNALWKRMTKPGKVTTTLLPLPQTPLLLLLIPPSIEKTQRPQSRRWEQQSLLGLLRPPEDEHEHEELDEHAQHDDRLYLHLHLQLHLDDHLHLQLRLHVRLYLHLHLQLHLDDHLHLQLRLHVHGVLPPHPTGPRRLHTLPQLPARSWNTTR